MLLKKSGYGGGILAFTVACPIAGVAMLLCLPHKFKKLMAALAYKDLLIRGAILGVTQIFICEALIQSTTAITFVASLLGSLCGVIGGQFLLNERLNKIGTIGVVCALLGSLLDPRIFQVSMFAVIAGALQGASMLMTRKVMINKRAISETVWVTLVVASGITAIYVFFRMGFEHVVDLDPIGVLSIAAGGLLVQLSVCNIYRLLDTQTAGALTLSRIPFAMGLDFLVLGAVVSWIQIGSASLIILGGLIVMMSRRKPTKINAKD